MADPTGCPSMRFTDIPMADDRGAGWRVLADAGKVVQVDGLFMLTHHDVVEHALKHPEIFSSEKAFDSLGSPLPLIPIATDPPDHKRYRRMLDPFFAPKRMNEREPELRAHVSEHVDRIAPSGGCEIMADLAVPFPAQTFLTLFGLPLDDLDRFLGWKDGVLDAVDLSGEPPEGANLQPALELYEYVSRYVADRRHGNGDDLLTRLIANTEEGGMTDEEVIGLCFLFVLAGLDTVTAVIGFSFAHLAANPDLRRQIVEDPSIIPAAIEELIRLEPPAPYPPRVTTEDVELDGQLIPAGSRVMVCLGAANRDPAEYADPDAISFGREGNRHFGFGGGVHRCLGSNLARLELRLVLEEFHRRIPNYELAPSAQPRVTWPAGTLSLDRVPLVFS